MGVSMRGWSSSMMACIAPDLIGRDRFNSLSLKAVKSWMVDERNVMRELYLAFFVTWRFREGAFVVFAGD
jgi:hypothetical protein